MASDSTGKKLTTAEILARARAEKSGAATAPASGAVPASSAPAPAAAKPAAAQPAAPASTGKPKSTAEILAAARAQKAGGAAPAVETAAEAPAPAAKPAPKPAAATAGAKPKSTAEILAAARAAKGGTGGATAAPAAATPAAKPVAKPAAKAAVAATADDGPKLSVEEMLAAVRPAAAAPAESKATPVLAPAAKVAPPAPVRPSAKPAAKPGAKGAAGETRRGFLGTLAATIASPFVIAWTALTASAGFAGLGLARFMLPNVLTEPPSKFKIGPPTDYDLGTVATKWVAQFGIWIVHTDQYRGQNLIYALASVCTHLGCTPSWLEGERKFKCPCHGSGFYITGVNFEGPAPRPLERVGIRLAEDGMLEVDKSVKFQEEMGQWNDAASFFEVTA
jgi:cytochrome b6-f complex iron-sulfur subunit